MTDDRSDRGIWAVVVFASLTVAAAFVAVWFLALGAHPVGTGVGGTAGIIALALAAITWWVWVRTRPS